MTDLQQKIIDNIRTQLQGIVADDELEPMIDAELKRAHRELKTLIGYSVTTIIQKKVDQKARKLADNPPEEWIEEIAKRLVEAEIQSFMKNLDWKAKQDIKEQFERAVGWRISEKVRAYLEGDEPQQKIEEATRQAMVDGVAKFLSQGASQIIDACLKMKREDI